MTAAFAHDRRRTNAGDGYRATGRGWQTRIDEDLAKAARRRAKRIA
jgi:hypothetical protein